MHHHSVTAIHAAGAWIGHLSYPGGEPRKSVQSRGGSVADDGARAGRQDNTHETAEVGRRGTDEPEHAVRLPRPSPGRDSMIDDALRSSSEKHLAGGEQPVLFGCELLDATVDRRHIGEGMPEVRPPTRAADESRHF